jgi:hypothetical protein
MQDDFTQDDFTPRRRRWPYVLAVLAVVAAAGWSGLWYFAAGRAEEVIAGWRAREARAGRIHTCGSQTVGGFPLRFEMRCTDPGLEVKSAGQPLSIKGKDVRVTANVWQPTRLTAEITGPLTVAEPGQPPTVIANWRHAQSELRGLPTAPEQVVLTFDRPVVERTAGGAVQRLFNAERLEITGRMLEGSARQNPVIEVVLNTVAAVAPTLHPLTQAPLDADVTAVLRGLKDFRPKPWPDRFREIQAAGGSIEISNARLQQGETIAVTKGTLALSPSGRPHGQVLLTVANLPALLPALGLDGRSAQISKPLDTTASRLDRIAPGLGGIARQNAAPALTAALNFIGKPAEIEGKRALTLPLRFNDGVATLGPIPLGQTAPLF